MLYRKRVGLIIWGIILIIFSLCMICAGASDAESGKGFVYTGFFFGIPSIVMLIFGVRNAVLVSQNNNEVMNDNNVYIAKCPGCFSQISTESKCFRPHRRYPEGYIYCPVCKRPISRNIFSIK